jgi:type I restriction enzyme M protein
METQQLSLPGVKTPKEVFRSIRNYLAGQVLGATRDEALLEELLKCLFCKLYIEMGAAPPLPTNATPSARARHLRKVFARVRDDFPELYGPTIDIALEVDAIETVFRECWFSIIDSHTDPIGDAFEVFIGSEARGQAGQFFTPRSVSDLLVTAVDPRPGELVMDPACGAGGFLTSVARHYLEIGTKPKDLAGIGSRTFFGIDKDAYLAKLARLHVALLTGGHPRIVCADSIAMHNGHGSAWTDLPREGFDVLLTNPPFGTRIVAAKPEVMRDFELARRWRQEKGSERWVPTIEFQTRVPPQVLFVERCLSLLREGGRLGMVVPESVLSNKSYRYVIEYLLEKTDVHAVIGMPESLFKTSGKGGTHTKTCLLIAEKRGTRKSNGKCRIFMAEAKWCGQDSRARSIPHNDLPEIAERFLSFKKSGRVTPSSLSFVVGREKIKSNVLCPRYYDPQVDAALEELRNTHDLHVFGELVKAGVLNVSTGDELGKLAYGTGDVPFIRTSDISNWELKADPKHGVGRQLFEALRVKQDVRPLDILMVKDGTYLVGTCAIITEHDTEIVYQSHLYKIRVDNGSTGLNPFLLLAVLSSPVVQLQIRTKQFTQDIIDSLGERLFELVLPIPKSSKRRNQITETVREAVYLRVRARELAKEARLAVAR